MKGPKKPKGNPVVALTDLIEIDHFSISDYSILLLALTEGTEVSDASIPGIHRLAGLIYDHAKSINDKTDDARIQALAGLAFKGSAA